MMIVASMILAVLATANTYDAPGSSAAELVASGTFNWESSPLATSRLDSVQLGTTPTAPSRFAAEGAGDATEAPAEDAASDDDCPVGAPPQSFTPTTRVELASGAFVPISSIKVGDKVLATDPTSGKTTAETVTATNIHGDNDLMDLVVHTRTGNQTIHTTDLHPVWDVTTGSWTLVEDLKSGDVLRSYDGHLSTVANTIQLSGSRDMWDLTVTTDHDFYVVVTGGTGVLVHNVDGPTRPGCDDEPVGTASGGAEAPAEGGESTLSNFGNASGPKAGRPSDFGISSSDETVGPFSPTAPTDDVPGASTFRDPATSGLTGHYWNIPADTELADGLGFHADGADVGGNAPFGHVTIYPTAGMTFEEFQGLVQGLPWEYGGKI